MAGGTYDDEFVRSVVMNGFGGIQPVDDARSSLCFTLKPSANDGQDITAFVPSRRMFKVG